VISASCFLARVYRKHNEDSLDESSAPAEPTDPAARELEKQGAVGEGEREAGSRERELAARERQLAERERECKRREGLLGAQQEALSASIAVKREKLEESNVHKAQMQDELQERHRQLQLLSGYARVQGERAPARDNADAISWMCSCADMCVCVCVSLSVSVSQSLPPSLPPSLSL